MAPARPRRRTSDAVRLGGEHLVVDLLADHSADETAASVADLGLGLEGLGLEVRHENVVLADYRHVGYQGPRARLVFWRWPAPTTQRALVPLWLFWGWRRFGAHEPESGRTWRLRAEAAGSESELQEAAQGWWQAWLQDPPLVPVGMPSATSVFCRRIEHAPISPGDFFAWIHEWRVGRPSGADVPDRVASRAIDRWPQGLGPRRTQSGGAQSPASDSLRRDRRMDDLDGDGAHAGEPTLVESRGGTWSAARPRQNEPHSEELEADYETPAGIGPSRQTGGHDSEKAMEGSGTARSSNSAVLWAVGLLALLPALGLSIWAALMFLQLRRRGTRR